MNFDKSYCVIGGEHSGKSEIAETLGGMKKITVIDFEKLKHLPKLEVLETMKKNNDTSKYSEKELDELIQLRKLLPNLKNYEDLGYSEENLKTLTDKYGVAAKDVYDKQFENLLMKELCKCPDLNDKEFVLNASTTLPVSFKEDVDRIKTQIKNDFPNEADYKKFIVSEEALDNKIATEYIKKFKNVIHAKLPEKEDEHPTKAKVTEPKDKNKRLLAKTEKKDGKDVTAYEAVATREIETTNLLHEGEINNDKVGHAVQKIVDEEKKKEEIDNIPKPKEASKKNIKHSFLAKFFSFVFFKLFGFGLWAKAFKGLKNLITGKKGKVAQEKSTPEPEEEKDSKVEQVSQEELDNAKGADGKQDEKEEGKEGEKGSKTSTTEKSETKDEKDKKEQEDENQPGQG